MKRISFSVLSLVVSLSCFGGDGPYYQNTTADPPTHTVTNRYFDFFGDAVSDCVNWVAALGYTNAQDLCSQVGSNGFMLAQAGWFGVGNDKFVYYNGRACGDLNNWKRRYVPSANACFPIVDRNHAKPNTCASNQISYGNPIYPLTGMKKDKLLLSNWLRLPLEIVYSTEQKIYEGSGAAAYRANPAPSFSELWGSSFHKKLYAQSTDTVQVVQASRGSGGYVSFTKNSAGEYIPDADVRDILKFNGAQYSYFDSSEKSVEVYTVAGVLSYIKYASGDRLDFAYSDSSTPVAMAPTAGLLIRATDQSGRYIEFSYEAPGGTARVYKITKSDGSQVSISYNAGGSPIAFTWEDAAVFRLVYDSTSLPWALTGKVDEKNNRIGTYGYDAIGRAISTERSSGVEKYVASYGTPPHLQAVETFDSQAGVIWRDFVWSVPSAASVTAPNGQVISIGASSVLGLPRLAGQSQPAGSGCAASTSSQQYDANGNVVLADDFNGHRVCSAYDTSRNLETGRVEGLTGGTSGTACAGVLTANAVLPAGSRKVSQTWHPDWRLATKVAEPGRFTTYVYNGQPDPFNANAVASCAPSTATLPDGKPIVVLCKRVEQATTDANGASAFTAALQAGVSNRVWQWTYNQYGQVLTEKDPLNNTTTSTYFIDTTADHTMGDLSQVSNALGQATLYTKYNKAGQVLQSQDPNGVITVNTYDARQRLTGTTAGGQATSFTWDPAGLLTKVTQANGAVVNYGYDAAQRLVSVSDGQHNTITYWLDASGNRTAEKVWDPAGALKAQVTRVIDALGRVQQTTGRE